MGHTIGDVCVTIVRTGNTTQVVGSFSQMNELSALSEGREMFCV
jgi:hypothetical protein